MINIMEFTTSQVLKILNLNRNTLQDWMDRGFVTPSIQKSTKQGEPNIFSRNDLYIIFLFNRLVSFGLNRKLAKEHSDISFENVGPKKNQIKYSTLTRGYVPDMKRGKITSNNLFNAPPTVDLRENDAFGLVTNLMSIKNEVDSLINKRGDS